MEHEKPNHTGYVSTDLELTESLKQLCTQGTAQLGRTVLQDIVKEAEGIQSELSPKELQIHLHHSKAASAAPLTRLATGKIDNGEVQTQTKWVSYSMTISFNKIYLYATKVMTQYSSLEIGEKSLTLP